MSTMHLRIGKDCVSGWVKCSSREVQAWCTKETQISREVCGNNRYTRTIYVDYDIEGTIHKITDEYIYVNVTSMRDDDGHERCIMQTVWRLRRSDFEWLVRKDIQIEF